MQCSSGYMAQLNKTWHCACDNNVHSLTVCCQGVEMSSFITQIVPQGSLLDQAIRFTRLASQWTGFNSEGDRLRTGQGPPSSTDSLTETDKMSTC